MPILETISSGSARGFGRGSGRGQDSIADIYKPAGTSRQLGLAFSSTNLLTKTADSTLTVSNINSGPTGVIAGGVANGGYATGWTKNTSSDITTQTGNAIRITDLPVLNGVNYTFVAWYKGTQTNSRFSDVQFPQWSQAIPVFGDPRGSVYTSFGMDNGRISICEEKLVYGGKNIADNQWHCLVWTINSSNRINAWVDGYQQLWDFKTYAAPTNNRADFIGQGYNYSATIVAPTNLDGIQIYNQVLSDAQIKEIAASGLGVTVAALPDIYTYARYWRVKYLSDTYSHQPRWSRIVLKTKTGSIVSTNTAGGDNCSDAGTISGSGTTYNTYDFGTPTAVVAGGMYTVYSGARGGLHSVEYSSDNSNWTEYHRANIYSTSGCGLYLTDGTNP